MSYHSELAVALRHHRAGRLNEAERIYREILSIDAEHADSLHLLGMIAHSRGRHEAAVELICQAIGLDPLEGMYYSNLGNVLKDQGRLDEAIGAYRQAVQLNAESADAHNNLGIALAAKGRHVEAVASYRRAIEINPGCAEAFSNLGQTRQAQGGFEEALEAYAEALRLRPDFADALYNLGNALQADGQFEAAATAYERALEVKSDFAEAYCNLGTTRRVTDRPDEALACYKAAIRLNPAFALAHYGSAMTKLSQEDFAGWDEYEWRWQTSNQQPMRTYAQPVWKGERLGAQRVLIWHEQGVGDEILFAGLVPEVLRGGTGCVLECDARLKPLFKRSFPEAEVGAGDEADFAAHIPAGSLPGLLRRSRADWAATTSPYLLADEAAKEQFRARYKDGRRLIGVAWYTNNKETGRSRSIDLGLFGGLFARTDIRWVSLQYGAVSAPILVDESVDQMVDIDGFAAQIAALDLVITIDNSTAHLAGALGVPVWVLLPFAADWRWFRGREDSPWYPTMRLFRQARHGEWGPVLERVMGALGGNDA